MMCGHAKELIAASWADDLDAAAEMKLRRHLDICPGCASEMTELSQMWERLADLPAPEPSQALNVRWQSTLESLVPQRRWKFSWWPVFAAAACMAAVIAFSIQHRQISDLREEVALGLLQQQSTSERLRGVDYSVRMPAMEPEVVSALISAVNNDSNVNVRLAAIDALAKVSGQASVRKSLAQSLVRQDSPMVQAALIGYVVDSRDRQALGTLHELEARPNLNPAVRQKASEAVRQLTEYR